MTKAKKRTSTKMNGSSSIKDEDESSQGYQGHQKKSKRRQVNKSENKPINNTNPSNERFYPEL